VNVTTLDQANHADYADLARNHARTGQPATAAHAFEVLLDAQCPGDWDRVVTNFDDVSYDQTATFSNLCWGEGRMSRFMLRQSGTVVAAARAAIVTLPGLHKGMVYMRGGPLWRLRGRPVDASVYRAAVDAIKAEYCARRGHHLIVTPRFNPDFSALEADMLKTAGFRALRKSQDPNRYFVNLALTQEQQMSSLELGWRKALKKSLANDFEIGFCNTQADLDCFIALNRTMLKRKKFHDSGRVLLLPDLIRDLPPPLRPKIILARHQGRPVVGAAIALTGDTVSGLFGASDDSMLPLKGGYAIQWWLIEQMSRAGFKWLDLGGESLSEGLRHFKRGLAGKQGRVLDANVEWEFSGSAAGRVVAELTFAARAAKRAYMKLMNG
jgi:hypothetical protein